jgi:hypothetical protein
MIRKEEVRRKREKDKVVLTVRKGGKEDNETRYNNKYEYMRQSKERRMIISKDVIIITRGIV